MYFAFLCNFIFRKPIIFKGNVPNKASTISGKEIPSGFAISLYLGENSSQDFLGFERSAVSLKRGVAVKGGGILFFVYEWFGLTHPLSL
jgi:hypothetical protein